MFGGFNINSCTGNKSIPNKLIMNPSTPWQEVEVFLSSMLLATRPDNIRCILWPTERDPVETPWLHIPITDDEVTRIYEVSSHIMKNSEARLTLVWGSLWEALPQSILGNFDGEAQPDNPFKTMDELAAAVLNSYDRLFDKLKLLPMCRVEFDIWNEMDVRTQPRNMELMSKIYPAIAKICVDSGIEHTMSTIIDPNGNVTRASLTYKEMYKIQEKHNLPFFDFVSANMNGYNEAQLIQHASPAIRRLKEFTKKPVSISEIDSEMSYKAAQAILYPKPRSVCYWR